MPSQSKKWNRSSPPTISDREYSSPMVNAKNGSTWRRMSRQRRSFLTAGAPASGPLTCTSCALAELVPLRNPSPSNRHNARAATKLIRESVCFASIIISVADIRI